jgi:DNA-binding NarL/FixJ family response regulator
MSDKRNIAVVDDHAMFRKGLTALISLFPSYEVVLEAANGRELIDKLDPKKLPDIVLMDINMPEMDGYASTEWLHNNYPEVRVLALSTMDAETSIIKMIKSGAKGYILKDADTEELQLGFDEVMNRGYFYNETITRKVMQSITQLVDGKNKTGTFIHLTDRETEFLKLSATELSYKEMAEKMFVSVRTVEGYRDALCEKLELKTRVGLAMYAVKNGLAVL